MRILEILLTRKEESAILTKRDIYYADTRIFKSQVTVDAILKKILVACCVPRDHIGVSASPKGLAYGSLKTEKVDYTIGPNIIQNIGSFNSSVTIMPLKVLVIEKEAVFNAVAQILPTLSNIHAGLLLITGKGYPDLATLKLVHWLHKQNCCQISIICDYDPYGLDIALNYKCGSKLPADRLDSDCPDLCYAGVTQAQIDKFGLQRDTSRHGLSKRDQNRLKRVERVAKDLGWLKVAETANQMAAAGFCTELESIYGTDLLSLKEYIGDILNLVK